MTVQVDYIFAATLFIITFALLISYTTDYYTASSELTDTMLLRSKAVNLLSIADCEYEYPCLETSAFRIFIRVNNTQAYLINQSHAVEDLTDELIILDFDKIYPNSDLNSVVIYYDDQAVDYQKSGQIITFKTDIDAYETKLFTLYFDDDSNFADRSTTVSGNNNLTERIYPLERFHVLQHDKIQQLLNSGYDIGNEYHIRIVNETDHIFVDYGDEPPKRGNVVALQRHVAYQNSLAGIEFGKLIVQLW